MQAFQTFEISPAFRAKYNYPQITEEQRANVFGLNALKICPVPADILKKHISSDKVALKREAYREMPDPNFVTYKSKTRRQFLNLKQWESEPHSITVQSLAAVNF